MDIDAEREKITKEIKELERILDPSSSSIHLEVSESSLDSDSEGDLLPGEDLDATGAPVLEDERWGEASNDEEDPKDKTLPEDPETCLQLNMVYQEVIREKLAEVTQLLAQNREQQEEILCDLAGSKGPKAKEGKSLPPNMYIGHFMKPYFKDRVTGVGPPANEDTREKAAQGIKAFEALLVTKWKHWEKALLRKSVVSDRLQRLLQPKLLKLEYLQQKQSRVSSEPERKALEKQIREAEKEIQNINQLPEEDLLGNRLDSHDWEKISNVNFEGGRSAEEIQKFWQSSEHPSINKQEWSAEEVEHLRAIAAAHGHLEWHLVAEELGTSRSAFQCLQKFQQHNTALKRKEWTEEEDRMLTQLVQEMRVGSHIPYRRIVYYMEGRDSMQLIYRWTKSLDPSLKKGFWAPEEDAKLLQAVAKYGEQDWFKIREEVPGRSDAQCRDRYLRRLHFSLKKGRWSAEEEAQLMELIEKHGVGHWAKIASELPHRSGSQCLSKWKIMVRKEQSLRRRRQRPRRSVRWSSSSGSSGSGDSSGSRSSSSSSSEDSEPELEEPQEGGKVLLSPPYTVPDIDLWVPARQGTSQPPREEAGCCPGHCATSPSPPKVSKTAQGRHKEVSTIASAPGEEMSQAQMHSRTHSTVPRGIQLPSTHPSSGEAQTCKDRQCVLTVPLETMLRVLRTSRATRSHSLKEGLKQPALSDSLPGPGPGDHMAGPHLRRLWRGSFRNRQRRQRHALNWRFLERRLLLAMTPWVGDVTLPCTQAPRRPRAVQTQADGIRTQLEHAHLASTPVFALFIQLLQIDTAGCMEVVRERKAQPPAPLQPDARAPPPHLPQEPSSTQNTPGCLFPNVLAQDTMKSSSHRGRMQLDSCQAESSSPQVPTPALCGPRPKPKTVSELLREKRLRESRARKAAQSPVALQSQLLVSSSVILQAPLPLASQSPTATGPGIPSIALSGPAAPAGAIASSSGSWQEPGTSAKNERRMGLQALPLTPALPGAQDIASAAFSSLVQSPVSCPPSSSGQSQTPATSQKQNLPKVLPFLPLAPNPTQLPMQPLSLMPSLDTNKGGLPLAASIPLPITLVLTTQGLLPVPGPAVVGLPRQMGTPGPTGLSATTLLQPPTETPACPWQPPVSVNTETAPPRCSPSLSLAEVGGDIPCALGEAQVAREISVPAMFSQADHPEAEPPCPSQLPTDGSPGPRSNPGGTPRSPSGSPEPQGPLRLERPPPPGPEKGTLDLQLLSQESEAAVREWLRGPQGACVPQLDSMLPYLPPTLCSLRVLSSLLLCKKALEHKAASLVASRAAGARPEPQAGTLQALLGVVQRQLQDNPAYLLLKTRFLAAFTLPALLATLSPCGVHTTLSAIRVGPESEDEDLLGELGLEDKVRQLGCTSSRMQVATSPIQGSPDPGEGSAPSHLDASDELDVLRTRHARHTRKRKRMP